MQPAHDETYENEHVHTYALLLRSIVRFIKSSAVLLPFFNYYMVTTSHLNVGKKAYLFRCDPTTLFFEVCRD